MKKLLSLHRYMGLVVAFFAIHLSTTGILLNHTSDIELDKQHVSSQHILGWYGIEQAEQLMGYQLDNNWISYWNNVIYFNNKTVSSGQTNLVGATTSVHFIALATSEEIWLLTIDGEIIERLNSPAEKLGDITKIGQLDKQVVIHTERGAFVADRDLVSWQPIDKGNINWSIPQVLPELTMQQILDQQHSISWERLLLDIHSGRLFTMGGVLLVDLAGLLILSLAITGVTIWFKRRRRKA